MTGVQTCALPIFTHHIRGQQTDLLISTREEMALRHKPLIMNMFDPIPTTLIKSNLSVISPLITQIINHSLNSGHVPPSLKTAIIKPLLKKPNLDSDCLSNYRPISHLPFLSNEPVVNEEKIKFIR